MPIDLSMPILLVDDFETMTKIVSGLLRQIGFSDIDVASSGPAALERMHKKRYGLVVSDWNMKPMNGLELLALMRANVKLASVPLILITAEARAQTVLAAKTAGVSGYIVKPFSAATLQRKLEMVLGGPVPQKRMPLAPAARLATS